MILCIDSGNTRIKWGLHDGTAWCGSGALSHAEVASLSDVLPPGSKPRAVLANVAGADAGVAIRQTLAGRVAELETVHPGEAGGGVRNTYARPEKLGVDRWCALVGARALVKDCVLVVMAGTATTIDTLQADGTFAGGLILPGLDMMRGALHRDTANLPLASGAHVRFPRTTDDAITTGCLEAQAGAIERAFAAIAAQPGARVLLAGGAAERIAPLLSVPCEPVDRLVLEGLRVLGGG